MAAPWVLNELKTADLKDKRLDNRLSQVLSQLGGHPTASIPAACGGNAEMTGAYRLFDNDKATFEAVLQPHVDSTRERIAAQSVVLLARAACGHPDRRKGKLSLGRIAAARV